MRQVDVKIMEVLQSIDKAKDKVEGIKRESLKSVVTYFLKFFLRDLSHFFVLFLFH